jgi:hypothetical protein
MYTTATDAMLLDAIAYWRARGKTDAEIRMLLGMGGELPKGER